MFKSFSTSALISNRRTGRTVVVGSSLSPQNSQTWRRSQTAAEVLEAASVGTGEEEVSEEEGGALAAGPLAAAVVVVVVAEAVGRLTTEVDRNVASAKPSTTEV